MRQKIPGIENPFFLLFLRSLSTLGKKEVNFATIPANGAQAARLTLASLLVAYVNYCHLACTKDDVAACRCAGTYETKEE